MAEVERLSVIDELAAPVLRASQHGKRFPIRQLACIELAVQPSNEERLFQYHIFLAYIFGQGCCYTTQELPVNQELIGTDFCDLEGIDIGIKIALLDAIYADITPVPYSVQMLEGDINERGRQRAEFIVSTLIENHQLPHGATVALVGAVGALVKSFQLRGIKVLIFDLDPNLVGHLLAGEIVQHGSHFFDQLAEVDIVLATAMTLWTNTYSDIAVACSEATKPLCIYAETGAHLAPYLMHHGATSVFSEPFPFYVFAERAEVTFHSRTPPPPEF